MSNENFIPEVEWGSDGLVPVVVQEETGRVLTLAYTDREALSKTLESGYAHYFSRRKGRIRRKGEVSGNLQRVVKVHLDCDGDALLFTVDQTGSPCHTGQDTCFYRHLGEREVEEGSIDYSLNILKELEEVIQDRDRQLPADKDYQIRLDKNESPYGIPGRLKEEVLESFREIRFNRYSPTDAGSLRAKLSQYLGCDKENIIVGRGSDELIPYALRIFSGKKAIYTPPTFSMYGFYARRQGIKTHPVPLGKEFQLQMNKIHTALDEARILFLCSPNNPTGNSLLRENIIELLQTGTPVVLDEAYHEFASCTYLDLVESFDNLLILRTFSKAFSLAGCRIGYAVGDTQLISAMLKIKSPYNLNLLSMKVAELALDYQDQIANRVQSITDERERIRHRLSQWTYPSEANFLLIDLDASEYLEEQGIAVRSFDGRLSDHFRVTVGTPRENDEFLRTMEDYLEQM